MSRHFSLSLCTCVLSLVVLLVPAPALADRSSRAEGGQRDKHEKKNEEHHKDRSSDEERYKDRRSDGRHESGESRFDDASSRIINDYYGAKFRTGKCPPGLSRKNNGCLPPGQAKKWVAGQPLPADLKRYDLPKDLLARLPEAPSGHRYVRVASDILLVAIGTGMVVDAIEDIGKQF